MAKGVKVTIFTEKLEQIDAAAQRALELTAEIIHGQVVQAQVMPFRTGHLQNESTFVDRSAAAEGHVDIVSSTPYARRLYYHPEYNFSKEDNPMREACGLLHGLPEENTLTWLSRHLRRF